MTLLEEANSLRKEIDSLDGRIDRLRGEDKRSLKMEKLNKLRAFRQKFKVTDIQNWIANSLNEKAILFSEFFGRYVEEAGLTTSQIRNVFGEVKRIQMKATTTETLDELALLMLQPKLAYAAKRADKEGTRELKDVLTEAIKKVLEEGTDIEIKKVRFENFSNFFEAILAYHKSSGGN